MAHGHKFAKLKSTTNQQKFSRNVKQFLNYLQVHSIIHILLLLLLLLLFLVIHMLIMAQSCSSVRWSTLLMGGVWSPR